MLDEEGQARELVADAVEKPLARLVDRAQLRRKGRGRADGAKGGEDEVEFGVGKVFGAGLVTEGLEVKTFAVGVLQVGGFLGGLPGAPVEFCLGG